VGTAADSSTWPDGRRGGGRPRSTFLSTASPPGAVRGLPPGRHDRAGDGVVDEPRRGRAVDAGTAGHRPAATCGRPVPDRRRGGRARTGPGAHALGGGSGRDGPTAPRHRPTRRPRSAGLGQGRGRGSTVSARGPRHGPRPDWPRSSCSTVTTRATPRSGRRRGTLRRRRRTGGAAGVPCLLVSPCAPLDITDFGPVVAPSRSDERAGWAPLEVADRTRDDRGPVSSAPARRDGAQWGRVVCVLNRKGRARLLACAVCLQLARCERCGAAVEQRDDGLHCRRCGMSPGRVQRVRVTAAETLRAGVTRVREELEALAGRPVGRITSDSDSVPDTPVVVGTEAVLHRMAPPVDGVAFLDFDQELLAPRYRPPSRQCLLVRAARLVGGRSGGGRYSCRPGCPPRGHRRGRPCRPDRLAAVERARGRVAVPAYSALGRVR